MTEETADKPVQMVLSEDFEEDQELTSQAKQFLYNGKLVGRDKLKCELVLEAVLTGMPKRRIMARYHVNFRTISAIVRMALQSGRLATEQQRIGKLWSEIAELSAWELRELILAGKIPAQSMPTTAAIAYDKHALATGQATEIVEQKSQITVEDVRARFGRARRIAAAPIDAIEVPSGEDTECDSVGSGGFPTNSAGSWLVDTGQDTQSGINSGPSAGSNAAAEGRGGGQNFREPPSPSMDAPSEITGTKEDDL